MAQRTIVHLVDDVTGEDADETVAFALDGQPYEIDLSAANASRLRDALSEFVGSARKASGGTQRTTRRSSARRSGATGDVRSWARDNGYQISERGRIPSSVIEAYQAAH
jgi:nucleoid-associated protein Lsr2